MKKLAKFFLFFFLILNFAQAANRVDEIKAQESKLAQQNAEERKISQKIEEFAKDILNAEKALKEKDRSIELSKAEIINLEKNIRNENTSLHDLKKQRDKFIKMSGEIEESVANLIMEDFLFTLLGEDYSTTTQQAFILNEILSCLTLSSKGQIENAVKGYEDILKNIEEKNNNILRLQKMLSEVNQKKINFEKDKKVQADLLKKIQNDRLLYMNRLTAIKKNQDNIRIALKNLKIIQENEDKEQARKLAEEKRIAAQKEAKLKELQRKENNQKLESKERVEIAKLQSEIKESKDKVRIIGSSYQNSRVKKYVGAKTIAPLKAYDVKQRFGNYIDPVYGIKIFNETVVLTTRANNAPVYCVLDGKVVFAKEVNMLHKVVIIEHKDQLHTIYANLSQIPSNIKVGAVVKKESIIGRVQKELVFEVTQKNFHINPLEIIK